MTIRDLNRFQKTYPLLRLKPIIETTGEGGGGQTIVKASLFKEDINSTDVYMPLSVDIQVDPSPFGIQISFANDNIPGSEAGIDVIMLNNGTVDKVRDENFNVDQVTGDAIFE
jgi:hypothetical protein